MDIIEILRWFRIFKFVSIVTLRKNQAQLVKYFQAYCLQADEGAKIEDKVSQSDRSLDDLMHDFDLQRDHIDKIMLYLPTGRNNSNVMDDWIDDEHGDDAYHASHDYEYDSCYDTEHPIQRRCTMTTMQLIHVTTNPPTTTL